MISIVRLGTATAVAAALVLGSAGTSEAGTGAGAVRSTTVHLASFGSDVSDDVADGGKCLYKVAGAGLAKKAGKSIWSKVKRRERPSFGDVKDATLSAAATELSVSPYGAGAMVFGCMMWTADPAG